MPKLYQHVKDYGAVGFSNRKDLQITDQKVLATMPGWVIMNSHPKPTDFASLFRAFVTYISTRCTWNPQVPAGGGAPLLDGEKTTGECALFAADLAVLAYAPAPYGLGLPQAQIEVFHYRGMYKKGFVSNHPLAGILNLQKNVVNLGQHLYLWSNHKVVKYQNRYWDPSYNAIYNTPEEMAAYELMPDDMDIGGTMYTPAEPSGRGDSKQGQFFKLRQDGRYEGPSTVAPF